MHAEQAYLFRHILVQRAAYELQPPSVRSRLHALALDILETYFNPPPPELAAELAEHAGHAARHEHRKAARSRLLKRELDYLLVASDYATRSFRAADAAHLWREVLNHPCSGKHARVDAAIKLSRSLRFFGDMRGALEASEQAVRLARRLKDGARVASSLINSGTLLRDTGKRNESIEAVRAALAVARRSKDKQGEATACGNLALTLSEGGESKETLAMFRRSIKLNRELGEVEKEAVQHMNLGATLLELGDYALAADHLHRAQEQLERLGNVPQRGVVFLNLAVIARRRGRGDEAMPLLRTALALLRQAGHRSMEAQALNLLANIVRDEKRLDEARQLYEQVLRIHRDTGNLLVEGRALNSFAFLLFTTGELGRVLAATESALRLLRVTNDALFLAATFGLRVHVLLLMGRFEEAQASLVQGFEIKRDAGLEFLRCHHLMLPAARVALARGTAQGGLPDFAEAMGRVARFRTEPSMADDATLKMLIGLFQGLARELELARKEKRQPLIFRGYLASDLAAETKIAALAHMQAREPAEYERLKKENPALLQTMEAGTETVKEPDWRNESPI